MFKNILKISTLLLVVFFNVSPAFSAEQKMLKEIIFNKPTGAVDKITFKLNGPHIPNIFALKGERPRVVFDFPNTKPARLLKNTINTNGKFVQRIRMGIHYEPSPKTRIVFDLSLDKKIEFKQNFDKQSNTLTITVFEAGMEPAQPVVSDSPAKKTPPPHVSKKQKLVKNKVQPAAKAVTKKPAPPNKKVKKVDTPPPPPKTPPAPKSDVKTITPLTIPNVRTAPADKIKKKAIIKKDTNVSDNKPVTKPVKKTPKLQKQKIKTVDVPVRPILKSVSFDKKSNRGEMVLFRLNTFQAPTVFGVEEGQPRVVCDFKETDGGKDLPESVTVNGKYIRAIRINKESKPKKIRVVLELASNQSFDLQQVFFKKENLFVLIINAQGQITAKEKLKLPKK